MLRVRLNGLQFVFVHAKDVCVTSFFPSMMLTISSCETFSHAFEA